MINYKDKFDEQNLQESLREVSVGKRVETITSGLEDIVNDLNSLFDEINGIDIDEVKKREEVFEEIEINSIVPVVIVSIRDDIKSKKDTLESLTNDTAQIDEENIQDKIVSEINDQVYKLNKIRNLLKTMHEIMLKLGMKDTQIILDLVHELEVNQVVDNQDISAVMIKMEQDKQNEPQVIDEYLKEMENQNEHY